APASAVASRRCPSQTDYSPPARDRASTALPPDAVHRPTHASLVRFVLGAPRPLRALLEPSVGVRAPSTPASAARPARSVALRQRDVPAPTARPAAAPTADRAVPVRRCSPALRAPTDLARWPTASSP